jgi:hypothetical protein
MYILRVHELVRKEKKGKRKNYNLTPKIISCFESSSQTTNPWTLAPKLPKSFKKTNFVKTCQ